MIFKTLQICVLAGILTACNTSTKANNETKISTDQDSTQQTQKRLYAERSKLFDDYPKEKIEIADFIDNYLNIMYDSTLQVRNDHWHSDILVNAQDFFFKSGFERGFIQYYPPKILGIRDLKNNQFLATILYAENNFPFKIMNLKIGKDGLNRPYFIDFLGENLKEFNKREFKNCTFYYSPKMTVNDTLEQKTIDFNQKMADFFNVAPKSVKIIALKDLNDYCNVLGYQYSTVLTYDAQSGGIAMPKENIIFSANNSAYYPHELVHLYTGDFDAHYWFDEGIATYFGGSVEHSLDYHLTKIANQMDSLDFSEIPTKNKKIDDDTNVKYSIGGLICKLAFEKNGKEGVFKLMNSGKTEEDFHQALKEIFGLEKERYDEFIKKELDNYRTLDN